MDNGNRWAPLNPVANAVEFPGANAGLKIAAAISSLPPQGGTVDCRGFGAIETIAGLVMSKPVRLLLGNTNFGITGTVKIQASGSSLIGLGVGITKFTNQANHANGPTLFVGADGSPPLS